MPQESHSPQKTRRLHITETVLRDAHQSLLATRMRTEDMLPILEKLDRVGYWSVEMWGGATFDSCMRFLREDPWDRLRLIRRAMPNTRLQMLMRGQNIVGYKHYPDDLVRAFVQRTAHYGMDVFRIFDALNDIRNMKVAIESVLETGKIAEGAISYTVSPFHTIERYVEFAKELAALGCQQICIKDMAGLLDPQTAAKLVRAIKEALPLPVHVHSHATSGMSEVSYLKAVEAGADIIDTAISALAGGTSQPPTESIVATFQGSPFDTGLDLSLLSEIAEYFRAVREKYAHFESKFTGIDPRVLRFQIPGGMISNLANQLREQGALDRIEEVLEEVPRVRAEMGFPPLVTPTSQIVGTQAVLNVLSGERYQNFSLEARNLLLGKYGMCPAQTDDALRQRAEELNKQPPITARPADLLEPILDLSREAVKDKGGDLEDDAISYALFPQIALQYFDERARGGPAPEVLAAAVSAVIFHLRQDIVEQDGQPNGRSSINPWKWAGRIESLRGRLFP